MLRSQVECLTEKQKKRLPHFLMKWQNIILSPSPTDRGRALWAITRAHQFARKPPPDIVFCEGPAEARDRIFHGPYSPMALKPSERLEYDFSIGTGYINWWRLYDPFQPSVEKEFSQIIEKLKESGQFIGGRGLEALINQILSLVSDEIWGDYTLRQLDFLYHKLSFSPRGQLYWLQHLEGGVYAGLQEFCYRELDVGNEETIERLSILQSLIQQCWRIHEFENVCVVCDRPTRLSLNKNGQLHAEASPAIRFNDGTEVYMYEGTKMPFRYGRVHPSGWSVNWLFETESILIRQILIKEIGYCRICQQLPTTELDSDKFATLLRIDVDIEHSLHTLPHVLKVHSSDQSPTAYFRVSDNIDSIRRARKYVKKHRSKPE